MRTIIYTVIRVQYARSRHQSLGFGSLMRTGPHLQWFKRTFGFLVFVILRLGFVSGHVTIRGFLDGQLKGESLSSARQQFGHAVHASFGTQRTVVQSRFRGLVVGPTFRHGSLEFVVERCCWLHGYRQTAESGRSLDNQFRTGLKEFTARRRAARGLVRAHAFRCGGIAQTQTTSTSTTLQ
jgi:hypothetical protein